MSRAGGIHADLGNEPSKQKKQKTSHKGAEILRNTLIYFLSKLYHSIKELLCLTSEILRPLEKGDRIE